MGRQQRIYGSLIFCLFLSGEDGLWATPFGQGQSSPQPSTHQDPLWAPLPVLWWVLPVQAGFGLLSQFWTNLEITLQPQPFFFFFYFQPQYCHFLPFTLSKKKKKLQCLSIFLEAPWNGGQGLIEVVSSYWLISLSLSSVSCQTVVLASHLLVSRRGSFYYFCISSPWPLT